MSMADELGKLDELRQSGALSNAEFEAAKRRLLAPNSRDDDNSIGRAANRYVSFQMVGSVIGLIIFLIFVIAIFLPMLNKPTAPTLPPMPGITLTPVTLP